ncbi:hypothetical protein Golob_014382 [Gossypium lobatum]|uniref:RNase H type-1 domain-containing protein n=1 Tax=Gossypium lobatum TaxID=34289 RepID=A0A7J8LY12_9ROSI|nr:hypothetical protein [Gossypium lobatum]
MVGLGMLWCFKRKLDRCWRVDRGYRKVEVENDNALLVETIRRGSSVISSLAELRQLKVPCNRDWYLVFRHVSRECNSCVDLLARHRGVQTVNSVNIQIELFKM